MTKHSTQALWFAAEDWPAEGCQRASRLLDTDLSAAAFSVSLRNTDLFDV